MISIIVPLFNHCEDLTKPFVERILKCKGNFELILVDNASSDSTRTYLKTLTDKRIKIVLSDINTGFGGGNNLGYEKAKGSWILFISNDVLQHRDDWIEYFENFGEENSDCLMGSMLVRVNAYTDFRYQSKNYINGFCVFGNKKLFESILHKGKVWDEDFGKAYFEDVDLSVRAVNAGYKLLEIPESGLEHLVSKSSDKMNIPEQFTFSQKVYRSKMFRYERKNKLRIVFYCQMNYKFTDKDYEGKGVGGAEGSLILLTRQLAKMGHIVDVYNDTDVETRENGVFYNNISNYDPDDYCDIFILFRVPYRLLSRVNSPLKVFWSCDQHTTRDWNETILPYINKTIAISQYHKDYLLRNYAYKPNDITILDLGINKKDYDVEIEKDPYKLIYCSVPMRGLKYVKELYLRIRERIPQVKLVITSDYRLWGAPERNSEFRDELAGIPGITFLGKVSREELVKEQLTSRIMMYPCNYDENFCISAMECLASGTIPVTTNIGAMSTTVGKEGIVINDNPDSDTYKDRFVNTIVNLLNNREELQKMSEVAKKRALELYSWEYLTKEKWIPFLMELYNKFMEKFKPNQCPLCKEELPNAFEYFKHKKQKHVIVEDNPEKNKDLIVIIKTKQRVEISINQFTWSGKELHIPHEYVSEVLKILNAPNGYFPPDVVISQEISET